MMAGLTAAVAYTSLKSNHDQQGQRFCGQENADDAAASETHPPPNAPLPEEPVLPSTAVDDPQGPIHDGVRKEPSFEADRDAADAGQQQPSIQGMPEIRMCSLLFLPSHSSIMLCTQMYFVSCRTFTTSSVLVHAAAPSI